MLPGHNSPQVHARVEGNTKPSPSAPSSASMTSPTRIRRALGLGCAVPPPSTGRRAPRADYRRTRDRHHGNPPVATHSPGFAPRVPPISPATLKDPLGSREPIVLIDLRPFDEYERGRLSRAQSRFGTNCSSCWAIGTCPCWRPASPGGYGAAFVWRPSRVVADSTSASP